VSYGGSVRTLFTRKPSCRGARNDVFLNANFCIYRNDSKQEFTRLPVATVREREARGLEKRSNTMQAYAVGTHVLYLLVSVAVTVWVARTLYRNGRVFLIDAFAGNTNLADSVNHLLVVGFYLINVGYVTLALKYGEKPTHLVGAIEFFSTKLGLVLVVLGVMHFFNLLVFSKARRRGVHAEHEGPGRRSVRPAPYGPLPPAGLGSKAPESDPPFAAKSLNPVRGLEPSHG
jgi:hypothetical protein